MGNACRNTHFKVENDSPTIYFLQKMRKENDACEQGVFQNYQNPLLIISMQKMRNMSMSKKKIIVREVKGIQAFAENLWFMQDKKREEEEGTGGMYNAVPDRWSKVY